MPVFRIGFVLFGCGLAVTGFTLDQWKLAKAAAPQPVPVSLADLESGKPLPNDHLLIGPHYALNPYCLFHYDAGPLNLGGADENTRIKDVYIPLISDAHPYIREWRELQAKFGLDGVPPDLAPQCKSFTVLLKTTRFPTVGSIPREIVYVESLRAMASGKLFRLSYADADWMRKAFPEMDQSRIILVDAELQAVTWNEFLVRLAAALSFTLIGAFLLFKWAKDRYWPRPIEPKQGYEYSFDKPADNL